jgi:hypothetical protein
MPQVCGAVGEHDTVMGPRSYHVVFCRGAEVTAGRASTAPVHNVVDVTNLGHLGRAQLEFIEKGLRPPRHAHRRPRAHPLWTIYERWGLGHRRRRAGALVSPALRPGAGLHGHIHQVMSKVEGTSPSRQRCPLRTRFRLRGRRPRHTGDALADRLREVPGIKEVRHLGATRSLQLRDDLLPRRDRGQRLAHGFGR